MASALYDSYKVGIIDKTTAQPDLTADDIKCALVTTTAGYTFSAAHDFYDDITNVQDTPVSLASKTSTGGAFDAADTPFLTVSGTDIEALVLYYDTGTPATSPLVAYIDGFTAVTPNGGDITVVWGTSIFTF